MWTMSMVARYRTGTRPHEGKFNVTWQCAVGEVEDFTSRVADEKSGQNRLHSTTKAPTHPNANKEIFIFFTSPTIYSYTNYPIGSPIWYTHILIY